MTRVFVRDGLMHSGTDQPAHFTHCGLRLVDLPARDGVPTCFACIIYGDMFEQLQDFITANLPRIIGSPLVGSWP